MRPEAGPGAECGRAHEPGEAEGRFPRRARCAQGGAQRARGVGGRQLYPGPRGLRRALGRAKAWDEAIGTRTEGASVRYKFEKVSKDGIVFGRISASRPGFPALNIAFQIQRSSIWVTLGLERRVDDAKDLDDLVAALKTQIVSYFL